METLIGEACQHPRFARVTSGTHGESERVTAGTARRQKILDWRSLVMLVVGELGDQAADDSGHRVTVLFAPGSARNAGNGVTPGSTVWFVPADFLSDAQVAAYGRFAGVPSRPELERFFFLDGRGLELIAGRRGDHSRLGLAVQVGTVRYLGRFLEDPLDVPWPVVEYLAGQLGIADASCVEAYTDRPKTAYEHAWEIRRTYGYRPFEDVEATASLRTGVPGGAGMDACRGACGAVRAGGVVAAPRTGSAARGQRADPAGVAGPGCRGHAALRDAVRGRDLGRSDTARAPARVAAGQRQGQVLGTGAAAAFAAAELGPGNGPRAGPGERAGRDRRRGRRCDHRAGEPPGGAGPLRAWQQGGGGGRAGRAPAYRHAGGGRAASGSDRCR